MEPQLVLTSPSAIPVALDGPVMRVLPGKSLTDYISARAASSWYHQTHGSLLHEYGVGMGIFGGDGLTGLQLADEGTLYGVEEEVSKRMPMGEIAVQRQNPHVSVDLPLQTPDSALTSTVGWYSLDNFCSWANSSSVGIDCIFRAGREKIGSRDLCWL